MATSEIGFALVITCALLVKESTGGKVIYIPVVINVFATYNLQSADLNIEDNLHHMLYYLMVMIVPRTCRIPLQMQR